MTSPPPPLSPTELRRIKDRLNLSSGQLAERLGVAPLTVRRWEQPVAEPREVAGARSQRGRPAGIPRHIALALSFLMLEAGLVAAEPTQVKFVLPRVLGSLLPLWAERFGELFGLKFDIELVDTGTDALLAVAADKAHVAAAANGLLPPFKDSVVEIGSVFRSKMVFALLVCATDRLQIGTEEKQFDGRTLLYPAGSDLGNILPASTLTGRGQRTPTEGVTLEEATQRFSQLLEETRRKSNRPSGDCTQLIYVGWEPLLTQLKDQLTQLNLRLPAKHSWRIVRLAPRLTGDLNYDLRLVCSKALIEEHPAVALQLMRCLAHTNRKFMVESVPAIRYTWEKLGIKKDDARCLQDKQDHQIGYEPSVSLLQEIPAQRVTVIDNKDVGTVGTGMDTQHAKR
jgi:hypothetical protein